MDAVALPALPGRDLVQKDNLAVEFFHLHVVVSQSFSVSAVSRQFIVVANNDRAADIVQMSAIAQAS